jgi:hypothetical protein
MKYGAHYMVTAVLLTVELMNWPATAQEKTLINFSDSENSNSSSG